MCQSHVWEATHELGHRRYFRTFFSCAFVLQAGETVKNLDTKTCYVQQVYALKLDNIPANFIQRIFSMTIWSSNIGGPENVSVSVSCFEKCKCLL